MLSDNQPLKFKNFGSVYITLLFILLIIFFISVFFLSINKALNIFNLDFSPKSKDFHEQRNLKISDYIELLDSPNSNKRLSASSELISQGVLSVSPLINALSKPNRSFLFIINASHILKSINVVPFDHIVR